MKKVLLYAVIIFLLLPLPYSNSFEEKDKPLDLSVDEALSLLKNFDPSVKVIEVRKSPVEGLWEVDILAGGKKSLVYVDSSKKNLVSGQIISIQDKKNLTQDRLTEINKVNVSKIPLDDAIVMGDKKAKYPVIVFDDPE